LKAGLIWEFKLEHQEAANLMFESPKMEKATKKWRFKPLIGTSPVRTFASALLVAERGQPITTGFNNKDVPLSFARS